MAGKGVCGLCHPQLAVYILLVTVPTAVSCDKIPQSSFLVKTVGKTALLYKTPHLMINPSALFLAICFITSAMTESYTCASRTT